MKKKVVTFICGDFNSAPRSGIYEFMRNGTYDVLKLDKYNLSGQIFCTYKSNDFPHSFAYNTGNVYIDSAPVLPEKDK